jgi:hypothetical protein
MGFYFNSVRFITFFIFFLIDFVFSKKSDTPLNEPYVYVGIASAFLFSYIVGGIIYKKGVKIKRNFIQFWVFSGFFNIIFSFLMPSILCLVFESLTAEHFAWVFLFLICSIIIGAIPIFIFGYFYGKILHKKLHDILFK